MIFDDLTTEERTRLKEAWDVVEPSDELERAVVDIARTAEPSTGGQVLPLWIPAVALAAAVLVLALFTKRHQPLDPELARETPAADDALADEDPDGTARSGIHIVTHPSTSQVAMARARNASFEGGIAPIPQGKRVRVQSVGTSGPIAGTFTESMPAQQEGVVHRFISRPQWKPGDVTLGQSYGSPRRAVRVGKRFMQAAKMALTARFAVVDVSTPESNAATTRLTVRADDAFDGWMALPEDVALALGLHQFEIPGEASLEKGGLGYRAMARLKLVGRTPVHEQEVFVERAPRPSLAAARGAPTSPVVQLRGPIPPYVAMTQGISYTARDGARFHGETSSAKPDPNDPTSPLRADVAIPIAGPLHLFLDYDDGRQLWLPPIDMGGEWGTQIPVHLQTVRWTVEAQACPPGSKFVASTVWRGTRATVAPAGVAFGEIKQAGAFEAVFRAYQDLSGLRAHVTRPDGTTIWVDAQLDDPGGVPIPLRATGARPVVHVHSEKKYQVRRSPADVVTCGSARDVFQQLRGRGPLRELGLSVDWATTWNQIAPLVSFGATLGIRRFRMQLRGSPPKRPEVVHAPGPGETRIEIHVHPQPKPQDQPSDGPLRVQWFVNWDVDEDESEREVFTWEGNGWTVPFVGDDTIEAMHRWWAGRGHATVVVHGATRVRARAVNEILRAIRLAGIPEARVEIAKR